MAAEMMEFVIVFGLVLLSLAYCISCTHWADRMSRKARTMQRWLEDQRAAESGGPYEEAGGGAE